MSEFIKHFGIDWKLLLAQIVNFGILFFILKKFAYGPILQVLRERKRKIEGGLETARQAEENLRKTDELREAALQKASRDALGIVSHAEQNAKVRQEEILQETNKKVEQIITDARRVIDGEKEKMSREVHDDAEDFIRKGIASIIGKMPSDERDNVLIREALSELKNI